MAVTRRLLLGSGVALRFAVPNGWGTAQAASPHQLPMVVIDPGHGGRDPGAIGVTGTYEKHVAFSAAMDLRQQLLASRRYRVRMTRMRDVFIPLETRVTFAQQLGADLFVSVHADALLDHSVRGASVYTLSDRASDPQAAALAARENAADRFAGPAWRGVSPEVTQILASLVRREPKVGSARLAQDLVAQLGRTVPLLVRPSRQAAFVVLKSPVIPSALVEMGFMSNRVDEAALRRPAHRAKVAGALHRAIDAYFVALRSGASLG